MIQLLPFTPHSPDGAGKAYRWSKSSICIIKGNGQLWHAWCPVQVRDRTGACARYVPKAHAATYQGSRSLCAAGALGWPKPAGLRSEVPWIAACRRENALQRHFERLQRRFERTRVYHRCTRAAKGRLSASSLYILVETTGYWRWDLQGPDTWAGKIEFPRHFEGIFFNTEQNFTQKDWGILFPRLMQVTQGERHTYHKDGRVQRLRRRLICCRRFLARSRHRNIKRWLMP